MNNCVVGCGREAEGVFGDTGIPVCFICYQNGDFGVWLEKNGSNKIKNRYSTVRMKSDRPRSERDFYPTPTPLIYAACNRLLYDETNHTHLSPFYAKGAEILDPGCGEGKWGNVGMSLYYNATSWGIDTKDNLSAYQYLSNFIVGDYLSDYLDGINFDLILGNPPFSLAEQFVHRSFDLLRPGGYIFFLLRLAFLEGRKRQLSLFEKLPLKRVYVLTRRPSFFSTKRNRDTTDTLAYAMFLWQDGYIGKPTIDWLYWENNE